MPRGGRRPGSGAPRGNTNALRTGAGSRRTRETWRALNLLIDRHEERRLRAVVAACSDAGLVGPFGATRANIGKIVQLIHPMLVDCPPTSVNRTNQRTAAPTPAQPATPPAAQSETSTGTTAGPAHQPDREKTTYNQNPIPICGICVICGSVSTSPNLCNLCNLWFPLPGNRGDMSANGHPGPLAGVKVLEFSEIIAAPFGGMLLADMGADVIKVEPPAGDPWRAFQPLGMREGRGYISLNRGKRGITIDLKTAEGREIVHALAERTDVVIINYRPDVAEKLGIDYATLSAKNPRLIYCDNTAFGRRGPHAHRPGYDIIAQALSGLMTIEGRREESGVPMMNGLPSADISTGIAIAWGISAALYARERTGRGQCISTTLMGSALAIQGTRLMSIEAVDTEGREAALAKINQMRDGSGTYKQQLDVIAAVHPAIGNIYYRCFQTADGFIAIGCLSTPLRRKLLAATGLQDARIGKRPEEIDVTDPETVAICAALVAQAEALFASKHTDEWMHLLDAHGVPAGPVRYTEELLDDEQVLENNFLTSVEHPMLGPVRMAAPMIQMTGTPLEAQGSSPTLGQHTDDVLRDLGYGDARIASLRASGVLGRTPG